MKKLLFILVSIFFFFSIWWIAIWGEEILEEYTEFRVIDEWTFNEYRYNMSKQYFSLRENFDINWKMDESTINELISLANNSYKYLPDNLENENYLNYLITALKKWAKDSTNKSNYIWIVDRLSDYIWNSRW